MLTIVSLWWGSREAAAAQPSQKFVFAHYMVCCPSAGLAPTVDDFLAEIRAAATAGIDGFALNCGGWSMEPRYKAFAALLFEAARQYGPDFKLFFSPDQVSADEAADMVAGYAGHPNYFWYHDKPVLSSFMGDGRWADSVRRAIGNRGIDIFFVPSFYPPSRHEIPTVFDLRWLLRENERNEGFFYFGATGSPEDLAHAIRLNGNALASRGKLFMAGIGVAYRGLRKNYRIFDNRGYESLVRQWQAVLDSSTPWVELTTWNDWGEASYVAPVGPATDVQQWRDNWGQLLTHQGFLDAHSYFIQWFKTGREPPVGQERLFYAYRLHQRSTPGRPDPGQQDTALPKGSQKLADRIYFFALLNQPAQLVVRVGKRIHHVEFRAGRQLASVPMATGAISMDLVRAGRVVAHKDAELPITQSAEVGNFNTLAEAMTIPVP